SSPARSRRRFVSVFTVPSCPTGVTIRLSDDRGSEMPPLRPHPAAVAFDGDQDVGGVADGLAAATDVLDVGLADDGHPAAGGVDPGDEVVLAVPPVETLVEGEPVEDLAPAHD